MQVAFGVQSWGWLSKRTSIIGAGESAPTRAAVGGPCRPVPSLVRALPTASCDAQASLPGASDASRCPPPARAMSEAAMSEPVICEPGGPSLLRALLRSLQPSLPPSLPPSLLHALLRVLLPALRPALLEEAQRPRGAEGKHGKAHGVQLEFPARRRKPRVHCLRGR